VADRIAEIRKYFPNADNKRFTIGAFYRFFIPFVLPNTIEKESYLGYRAVLPSLGKISRLLSGNVVLPTLNSFLSFRQRFVKLCTQPMRLRRLIPVLAR